MLDDTPPHALPARSPTRSPRPSSAWRCSRRARRRRSTASTASCGASRRSCSRSSTRRTRSACSPRCCSPAACPTRSAAGRCCSSRSARCWSTTVLFMLADSVVWLFVARGLQGLATGLALGAASAALLDLHPRRDPAGVGLANGVVSAGGIGLGVLVVGGRSSSSLPAPRVLPYVVLFALFAIAFAGALLMPEPVAARSRPRLTPQRPSVPPVVRRPFLLAGARRALLVVDRRPVPLARPAAVGASCSTPTTTSSAGAQRRSCSPARARSRSSCSAAPRRGSAPRPARSRSPIGLLADRARGGRGLRRAVPRSARVVGGAGFGVAFLGALRALSAAIPHEHRAQVMSAFYVVAYSSLSLPAVAGRHRGHPARPRVDVRDLRQRRRRARARAGASRPGARARAPSCARSSPRVRASPAGAS